MMQSVPLGVPFKTIRTSEWMTHGEIPQHKRTLYHFGWIENLSVYMFYLKRCCSASLLTVVLGGMDRICPSQNKRLKQGLPPFGYVCFCSSGNNINFGKVVSMLGSRPNPSTIVRSNQNISPIMSNGWTCSRCLFLRRPCVKLDTFTQSL